MRAEVEGQEVSCQGFQAEVRLLRPLFHALYPRQTSSNGSKGLYMVEGGGGGKANSIPSEWE